ncbi:hypothetical protein CcI49_07050 [Frankia sp. CcI49]|uniref:oxygenase MpaB family protein n=1 Tax=Frankia sp. CcI49 TaxID=1745382 RepID=UPI000976511E|nr:oxygenase MpaB family protein [Frankia sp. CcI49]ONH61333.1 hypothetical protein CcI49_07050 [Frankia sp. CcI49]
MIATGGGCGSLRSRRSKRSRGGHGGREISTAGLDPDRDWPEIVRLLIFHEFPWDARTAGKLTIWHLFAVPSTASVVGSIDALAERAEETSLTFGDLLEHGFESPVGRDVLRMVNRAHRGWGITDGDQCYAIASLAVTLVRWLDRYGWRAPTPDERSAIARFYLELGRRMGVRGLPADYDGLAAYLARWERDRAAYSPLGERVSEATIALAESQLPRPLVPLVRPFVATLLEPQVRAGVGLALPPVPVRVAIHAVLRARATVVRRLPPRRHPTTPRTRRRRRDTRRARLWPQHAAGVVSPGHG